MGLGFLFHFTVIHHPERLFLVGVGDLWIHLVDVVVRLEDLARPVEEIRYIHHHGTRQLYLWTFLHAYALWPLVLLPVVFAGPLVRSWDRRIGLLACLVAVTCAYVIGVGGDFIEFRLLVPMLPSAMIVLFWLLFVVARRPWLTAVVAVFLVGASQLHARSFDGSHGIESVANLRAHLEAPEQAWVRTGEVLGELFGGLESPSRIATTASGAVPFASELPAVDILGLMDPWVARHGR